MIQAAAKNPARASALSAQQDARVVVAVTDEAAWRDLRILLAGLGAEAEQTKGAAECLKAVSARKTHLAVIGLALPDGEGLMLCRVLAERPDGRIPVIVVADPTTTQEEAYDCFEAGAKDFLRLPLDPLEVAWRVRSHLRRGDPAQHREVLVAGGLLLDLRNHTVNLKERQVCVTPSECSILRRLMEPAGRAVPIETLLVEALGYPARLGNPEVVRTHVRNLRLKLEADPRHPHLIINLPRIGYVLRSE